MGNSLRKLLRALASRRVDSRAWEDNNDVRGKNKGNKPALRGVKREREREEERDQRGQEDQERQSHVFIGLSPTCNQRGHEHEKMSNSL